MPQQGTDVIAAYETAIWRQGWYFGLGFKDGYVFGKTLGYEPVLKEWNLIKRTNTTPPLPAPLDTNEFVDFQQVRNEYGQPIIGSAVGQATATSPENHLYQLFRGMYPNCLRTWTRYNGLSMWDMDLDDIRPGTPGQQNVDNGLGYLDGNVSPFNNPSLTSELIVPYNLGFTMAALNDSPWQQTGKVKFAGVRHLIYIFKANVEEDMQTVGQILDGKKAVTLNWLGPVDQGVPYAANRESWQNAATVKLTPADMARMSVRRVA